jgi:hypothetical protein
LNLFDSLAWNVTDESVTAEVIESPETEDLFDSLPSSAATGRSTQMDLERDIEGGGWLTYRFESPSFTSDELRSLNGVLNVDSSGDSIVSGMIPWHSVLGSRIGLSQHASDGVEHVVDLSPLEQTSSLALVATLWTAPSGSHPSLNDRSQPGDGRNERLDTETSPPWMIYVMGLDQAFERSSQEVRQGLIAEARSAAIGGRSLRSLTDGLEWHGPIFPVSPTEVLESNRESPGTGGPAPSKDSIPPGADPALRSAPGGPATGEIENQPGRETDHHADAQQQPPAVPDRLTMLSVVAGSTLIAGWFFSKRTIWTRRRSNLPGFKNRPNG